MKKIIAGSVLFLSGMAGTLSVFFIASSILRVQVEIFPTGANLLSWENNEGVLPTFRADFFDIMTKLKEMQLYIPMIIFIGVMVIGITFLIWGAITKEKYSS